MNDQVDSSKKKEEEEEEEKIIPRIVYIGSDSTYFNNLQAKYKEISPSIEVEFQHALNGDDSQIQSIVLKIRNLRPKLVILDLSQNEIAMLHLIRLWMRHNSLVPTPMIALSDYTQGRSMVIKAIMTTVPCVHIKSSELEAVVHDINMLAFPLLVEDHGFALAELADPIKAYYPAKVSMLNENFLKIESDISMQEKQQVRLHNFWNRTKIINSNLMMCATQSMENIYYNYEFTQFLQMAHADPVAQEEGMTQDSYDAAQEKRKEDLQNSKNKLAKWIREHKQYSRPKFLKAFVVDKAGIFFKDRPLSDSYIYVFRNQPFVANAKKEITKIKPQLIIWNLEKVSKSERDNAGEFVHTLNDIDNLTSFAANVKEVFQGFQPVILVFNAGENDTATLKGLLDYQSVLAVKEPMNIDMVLRMCEMLRSKIEPSLPKPGPNDVYVDKNSDISYCEIESNITLMGCSENDIYFNSETQVPLGTVLRVSLPVPMYITVCKKPEFTKLASEYYGFIHGIGEAERQQLRRYINEIFFRDHDQKKQDQQKEREALKQKYLDDKEAAKTKEAQAEAKKQKEEEERNAFNEKAQNIVDELED